MRGRFLDKISPSVCIMQSWARGQFYLIRYFHPSLQYWRIVNKNSCKNQHQPNLAWPADWIKHKLEEERNTAELADLTNWTSPRYFLNYLALSCQVLSLDHNQLWDFPVWSLSSLPRLARLSVGENSWPCDCLTVRNIQQLSLTSLLADSNVACTSLSGNNSTPGSWAAQYSPTTEIRKGKGKLSSILHLKRRGLNSRKKTWHFPHPLQGAGRSES